MSFLFPFFTPIGRWNYMFRLLVFMAFGVVFEFERLSVAGQLLWLLVGISFIAAFVGRIRDAGLSPWVGLVLIIPVFGWLFAFSLCGWKGRRV
jgi:uncharacterized membrane protein YhaH (DUF805 family)